MEKQRINNKRQEPCSFKDNLRDMLVSHSFRPALEMEVICILVVVCIGGFWGLSKNRNASHEICETLNAAVTAYDGFLIQTAEADLTGTGISSTKRTAIMKALYTASIQAGYDAEFYLLDKEGRVVTSSRGELSEEEKGSVRNWRVIESVRQQPGELQMDVSRGTERYLFLARSIERDGQYGGCVILKINGKVFDELLARYSVTSVIVGEDYWVLETDAYQFVDSIGKLLGEMRAYGGIKFFEHGIYYGMHQMPECGYLTVYTYFNYTEALRVLATVLLTGAVVLFFLFFAGVRNAEKMAVKATEDIYALNEAFSEVTKGNLHPALDIHSSTEFENIGQGFNQMISSLKHQMEENRELAEAVAYEQVKQLASQFKSHFLFNTLDNIRFICRLAPKLAESMVISLSELLRYNTGNPNEKVTIAEDINYIKKYFEIIKVRFGDAFTYHIEVEEEVKEAMILKLLIQPLVENAIKYGFGERDHMEIFITAHRQGNNVCISCRDDGDGIRPELLAKIQDNLAQEENKTPHLGLYNVHRRLQLTYGQEYGLSLENCDGLRVTVIFPMQME